MSHAAGFTLVELLVSIGIFTTVVAIAVGNFVTAFRAQRQVSALISSNSNMSLTLEQMAREMRTGSDFACGTSPITPTPDALLGSVATCSNAVPLTFVDANGNNVRYSRGSNAAGRGFIQRASWVGAGTPPASLPITSDDVDVRYLTFNLSGTLDNDLHQSRITILIGASPIAPFISQSIIMNIQTTMSSRSLDG